MKTDLCEIDGVSSRCGNRALVERLLAKILDLPALDDARHGQSGFTKKLFYPERDLFSHANRLNGTIDISIPEHGRGSLGCSCRKRCVRTKDSPSSSKRKTTADGSFCISRLRFSFYLSALGRVPNPCKKGEGGFLFPLFFYCDELGDIYKMTDKYNSIYDN